MTKISTFKHLVFRGSTYSRRLVYITQCNAFTLLVVRVVFSDVLFILPFVLTAFVFCFSCVDFVSVDMVSFGVLTTLYLCGRCSFFKGRSFWMRLKRGDS